MNFETLVRDMIALRKEYREKTRSGVVHTQSDAIAVCRAFKNKYREKNHRHRTIFSNCDLLNHHLNCHNVQFFWYLHNECLAE